MRPASLVAWRWASVKYAGTVMTASVTLSPKNASASRRSFCKIIAEISTVNKELILAQPDSPVRQRALTEDFCNFYHAPTVIVISSDDLPYGTADAANAAENICIAAHSLQLGSCYIASFLPAFSSPEAPRLLDLLRMPQGKIPRFAVALGYIKGDSPEAPKRKENNVTVIE